MDNRIFRNTITLWLSFAEKKMSAYLETKHTSHLCIYSPHILHSHLWTAAIVLCLSICLQSIHNPLSPVNGSVCVSTVHTYSTLTCEWQLLYCASSESCWLFICACVSSYLAIFIHNKVTDKKQLSTYAELLAHILSVNLRHIRLIDLVSAKGKTKVSWLILFHSLIRECFNVLIRHSNPSRIRNIKIERLKQLSQQYTSFVFPFAKTRPVDRENVLRLNWQ